MGQYQIVVNLDKREFLEPAEFSGGSKLAGMLGGKWPHVGAALVLLLAHDGLWDTSWWKMSNEVDLKAVVGRWAGDRIIIAGDYGREDFLMGVTVYRFKGKDECAPKYGSGIYLHEACREGEYHDITPLVIRAMKLLDEEHDESS